MSITNTEIRCPKCNSDQLTSNKKGFSGKKAVVGALLTGGIGVLAGTIGSGQVKITCLACGNEFKPGEGKSITVTNTTVSQTSDTIPEIDSIDQRIIELWGQGKKIDAIKHCNVAKGLDLRTSKKYVEQLAEKHKIVSKPEGCFIATACYGEYNDPSVIVLRKFRDEKLLMTFIGTFLVKIYYLVSPLISRLISKSGYLKRMLREYFLKPIVSRIQRS